MSADKSRIIEIRVDTQFNEKRLGQLESSLASVQKARAELLKQAKTQTGLNKQEEAELGRLSSLQQRLSGAVAGTKKNLKELNKEKKTALTSYDAITQRNAKLAKELRALADPLGKNKVRFQELAGQIKANTEQLARMDEAQGRFQRNVGNYPELLGKIAPAQMAVVSGLRAMVMASLAFIATPLGMALAAIAALAAPLVAFFTKTQRGMDMMSKAGDVLGAIMSVLVDRLSAFGEKIVKAFSDPVAYLQSFGNSIQKYIVEKVALLLEGVGLLGSSFKKLFKGDFSGAAQDGAKAVETLLIKMNPLYDITKAIVEETQSVVAEMKEEGKAMALLSDRTKQLIKDKRAFIVEEAKLENKLQEARTNAANSEIEAEERLKGINDALALNQELEAKRMKLVQEELSILKGKIALGETLNDELDKQAELEKELFLISTRQLETEKTLLKSKEKLTKEIQNQGKANKELIKSVKDLNAEYLKEQEDLERVRLFLISDAQEKELAELAIKYDQMVLMAQNNAELEKALIEKQQKDIAEIKEKYRKDNSEKEKIYSELSKTVATEALNAVSDTMKKNFERQRNMMQRQADTERRILDDKLAKNIITEKAYRREVDKVERKLFEKQKKQSIRENTLNSAVAVMKSLAQYGWTPAFGVAAAGIGAALIAQNIAVDSQQYEPLEFERGGVLQGKSHAQGGVPFTVRGQGGFEAEGGEALINKRSTQMFAPLLSAINEAGGGVKFAKGGMLPSQVAVSSANNNNSMDELINVLSQRQNLKVINVATDTNRTANRVHNLQSNATFG